MTGGLAAKKVITEAIQPNSSNHAYQADPNLVGPENLCIIFGGVIGTFSGGGDPQDVYSWEVTDPQGNVIFDRTGGGPQFETVKVAFNEIGLYKVELSVRRATSIIYQDDLTVNVKKGPELVLLPDYLICSYTPVQLSAIDPNTSTISDYTFIWKDFNGKVIGNQNTVTVLDEGFYQVELFLTNNTSGAAECLITGTTYVGPSLDFEIQLSKSSICQGEALSAGLDTPYPGDWSIIKPGSNDKTDLGSAFEIPLSNTDISSPGEYTIIFSAIDPNYPGCRSERRKIFTVNESPNLNFTIQNRPDNCVVNNGAFTINASTDLDSLIVVEIGFFQSNVPENQAVSLSNLEAQIYTISAYSNGCKLTTLLDLAPKDPPINTGDVPDINEPTIEVEPETCGAIGVNPGKLKLTFNQGNVDGEYRVMSNGIGTIVKGFIQNQQVVEQTLAGGTYFLELNIDGCAYPTQEIIIESKNLVNFSVPKKINICESFELIPETSEDLILTLTDPSGNEITKNSGEPFILTKGGSYSLLGKAADSSTGGCPKRTTFEVNVIPKINFDLILLEEDCFGNRIYKTEIAGLKPEQTSIRWLNESGDIVGRGELFYPTSNGRFTLNVQPLETGSCPNEPIAFEIEPPVLSVPMDLSASKICPEPGTSTITLSTTKSAVNRLEWIYFDINDNREDLPQFQNQFEIEVTREGSYEAVAFNKIGCEIGRNFIQVEKSTLLTPPNLEEVYTVCSKKNNLPGIDPGDFASYEWYFEEDLVSTNRIYKPDQVGTYSLIVTTVDGCEFFSTFTTYDACNFKVVFPNAMVLNDSNRDFRVLVSQGVTEAEVFIYNRTGELIFHSFINEIPIEKPILNWDGRTLQGSKVPLGTYAVVLALRNKIYGFEEKITSSLFVIE
ncbi:MAG: hypothetical protein CL554_19595 [Algoriphagus sp.]|nr:hypothetical protein [Algoriphagus sp.]HCH45511.1 hypothetical protein [Algoriphagus sp.]